MKNVAPLEFLEDRALSYLMDMCIMHVCIKFMYDYDPLISYVDASILLLSAECSTTTNKSTTNSSTVTH